MRITVTARRYAKALAGMIKDPGLLEKSAEELRAFQHLLDISDDLRTILLNPGLIPSARKNICLRVAESVGFLPHIMSFLGLLIEKGRLRLFSQIVHAFQEIADDRAGRIRAEIRSSTPLPADTQAEIKDILERVAGKSLIVSIEEDPALLGGIIARIGSRVFDFSLRTHLERLRNSIAQG